MDKHGGRNFVKGRSGNPSGRPKELPGIMADCRAWAKEKGIQFIKDIVADKENSDRVRLAAAIYLVDRGFGKTTALVEHSGSIEIGNEKELSSEQLKQIRAIIQESETVNENPHASGD